MNGDSKSERAVLELFLKLCRSLRDPRNRRNRTELIIPATRWELKFQERMSELEEDKEVAA